MYTPNIVRSSWQLKKEKRKVEPFGKYDGAFKEDYRFVEGSGDLDECNGKFVNSIYKFFETETFRFSQDAIGITFQKILYKRDNKLS